MTTRSPEFAADDEFDATDSEVDGQARMSFLEHLDELRRRLIYSIWALAGCFAVTFWFWEPMFRYLTSYFQSNGGSLIYSAPTSGFMFSLKVSGVAALIVAAPFIFCQLWLFVAPGLYKKEKRVVVPFVICSSLLFFAGAAFAHFVAFPMMWQFFASYQIENVKFLATLDDGRVARASLDCVDPEPLPAGHWMYSHPKVRLSAHVSWASPNATARMFESFASNLRRYVDGKPLVGVIDVDEGY